MAKFLVLSILFFFLLRWLGRLLILPTKIAEDFSQKKPLSQEKDISQSGRAEAVEPKGKKTKREK